MALHFTEIIGLPEQAMRWLDLELVAEDQLTEYLCTNWGKPGRLCFPGICNSGIPLVMCFIILDRGL